MSAKKFFSWVLALVGSFVLVSVVMPLLVLLVIISIPAVLGGTEVKNTSNQVAVLELDGVILDSREIVEELYKQIDNENVKGVVLRINSPGGAVGPSQEIYSAVKKLKTKKPIVASMGSLAASGGLYAALGASKIYAMPGTLTGSIGVILQVPNVQKITDLIGFKMQVIKSGEFKDTGNSFREMTERDRNLLQNTVDHAYADFVQAVVDSRSLSQDKVKLFADGRIILGAEALNYGLIDAIGGLQEAAKSVMELSGQPLAEDQRPNIVYPLDKMKYFKQFFQSLSNLPQLLELRPQFEYRM